MSTTELPEKVVAYDKEGKVIWVKYPAIGEKWQTDTVIRERVLEKLR